MNSCQGITAKARGTTGCPASRYTRPSSSSLFPSPRLTTAAVARWHQKHEGAHLVPHVGAPRGSICAATPARYEGALVSAPGTKYGVVVARFNSLVTEGLLEGAIHEFGRRGVPSTSLDVAYVPGAFELPVIAKAMAKSGKYAAVVCIAAVIRGATSHYDAVVGAATSGVLGASVDTGVPVIFGVLTTDSLEQALDRTGGKVGNKGGEAAATAIEMADLLHQLKRDGNAL